MSEYDRILIDERQDEIRRRAQERKLVRESRDAARPMRPAASRHSALRPGMLRYDLRRLLKGGRRRGMA